MPRASKCANPMFLQWLEELRDEQDQESNRYVTYNRATKALQKHPDHLDHPSKCIEIKGIGPKIVQVLTLKHIDHNGGVDVGGDGIIVPKKKAAKEAKAAGSGAKKRASKQKQASSSDTEPSGSQSTSASSQQERIVGGVPFVKHTILANGIVVVNKSVPNGGPAAQVELAQQRVRNNSSTPAGMVALAQKRARANGSSREMDFGQPPHAQPAPQAVQLPPAPRTNHDVFPFSYLDERNNRCNSRDTASKDILGSELFHKIEFPSHASAHLLVSSGVVRDCTERGTGTVWAWISDAASDAFDVCPGFDQPRPGAAGSSRQNTAAERAPGPSRQNSVSNLAAEAALRRLSGLHNNGLADVTMRSSSPVQPLPVASSSRAQPAASSSRVPAHARSAPLPAVSAPVPAPARPAPHHAANAPPAPARGGARKAPRLSAQMPIPQFDGASALRIDSSCIGLDGMDALAREFPAFRPVVLPPNTYRIVLMIDAREDRRVDYDRIGEGLLALGVRCERRSLHLGDVLWVAQRLDGYKRGDEYDEVALDFIVERKRMDDLVQSIKQPRYHDQKFRLHSSAISHIYYLVEGHNEARYLQEYGQQIATVVSSTQVVDGFMVKETDGLKDSVRYLANLHGAIEEHYRGKPINVIPTELVRPHSFVALQKHLREIRYPDMPMHTSLSAFQNNNRKQGHITVSEAWARMLLGMNGLSAAKVAAIRVEYEGPAQLRRAFMNAEVAEAVAVHDAAGQPKKGRGKPKIPKAESLLTELGGKGREVIGAALSKRIYRVMRARAYDAETDSGDSTDGD